MKKTDAQLKLSLSAIFIVLFMIVPASAGENYGVNISAGETVFIGESGLNISAAIGSVTQLAWYNPTDVPGTDEPSQTVLVGDASSFYVSQDFVGYIGQWYAYNDVSNVSFAFYVYEPSLDIAIIDSDSEPENDLTDGEASAGERVTFCIETNLFSLFARSPCAGDTGGLAINVTTPDGSVLTSLCNSSGVSTSLTGIRPDRQSYYIPIPDSKDIDVWNTSGYSAGTYNISVECNVNSMMDTLGPVAGKTISKHTLMISEATIAPVASFNADLTWGEAPFTVHFNDTSSGSPTSYQWDFGDEGSSTDQNASHTYTVAGTYTVSLTATNSGGYNTTTMMDYITVAETGSSLLADSAWPEYGYDSMHTGRSPYNGPQTALLKEYLSFDKIYGSPAIGSDGSIYIGGGASGNIKLHAIDPNGTQKWEFSVGDYIYNTPAVSSDGTIYFGSYDGNLYALNPDGTKKWCFNNGEKNRGSPVIGSDGTIYFGSYDGNLYALNPDGTKKWHYTTSDKIYGTPAIGSDGTIYIGSNDYNLYAINPENGTLKWYYPTTYKIYNSPAVDSEGIIYIGDYGSSWESYGHTLYAINPNGSLKWKYDADSSFYYGSPVTGCEDSIYIPSATSLLSMNSDGSLKWEFPLTQVYDTPTIDSEGTIYICSQTSSSSGNVYAINPDGTIKWEYSLATKFYAGPVIGSDGTLYVGGYNGNLYEFENVVDFKTDKTVGKNPLNVQFISISSRIVSSWFWDFGDNITSTDQNPSHIYTSDGSYSINLTITDQDSGETFSLERSDYIIVYSEPEAKFTANITSEEVPMTVNFTDKSTNSPTSWLWEFGDGNTSTLQNPTHTYYSAGTYDVTLYAENPAGSTSHTETDYITVEDQPVPIVDFSSPDTTGQAPLTVSFTDQSENSPLLSWEWDFGDGENSTGQNPAHTYDVYGNYTVGLTVTNYGGLNTTVKTDYIRVVPQDPPVVSFEANKTLGMLNMSVKFTDHSTGYNITGWYWDFDDGTNSTEQNPVHIFKSERNYDISLNVTNDGGSNVTSSQIVVKNMITPVANFTANRTSGRSPLTVQFTDESELEPTSWSWEFGDGGTSTDKNPVHTYMNTGNYTVTLTASNAAGSNTITKTDYIECSHTNAKVLENYQLINVYVSNDEGPKYAYESDRYVPGTYFMVFESEGGGFNPLDMQTTLGLLQYDKITTNQTGTFWIEFSGGRGSMDDGVLMVAVNGTIPDDFSVHIRSSGYNWPLGNVNTDDYVEGALDETFTRDDFLYGPQNWRPASIADYPITDRVVSGDDTFEFMFIDLRAGLLKEGTDGGAIKVEYSFNNLTSIAVFNAYAWDHSTNHGTGIPMTSANPINIVVDGTVDVPVADFSVISTEIANEPVQFTDTSSGRPYSWYWDFGDGKTSTKQNPEHTYSEPGEYTVNLTATNYLGSDTKNITIKQISGILPEPSFTADVTSGVSPFEVSFTDTSTNFPVSWAWDFGDGTTSTEQNATHWYAPGIYTVSLTVENGGGSTTHTEEEYIVVTGNSSAERIVNSGFENADLSGWESGAAVISMDNVHDGSYSTYFNTDGGGYIEQYIDLTDVSDISFWVYKSFSGYHAFHKFTLYIDDTTIKSTAVPIGAEWVNYVIPVSGYSGMHMVRIAYNDGGTNHHSYLDNITLAPETAAPVTRFATTSNTSGEYPLTVQFTDASSNYPTEWAWDFNGDGVVDSNEQSPSYTFKTVGTYKVSLTAKNGEGDDSAVRANYITVKGVKKITTDVSIRNNGTLTDNGNGKKQYTVNQSEAKVEGNDIVIDSGSYTVKIKSDNAPATTGGNIVAEVAGIELETDPVEAILDELGNVSGSVNLELNDLPEDSGLEVTIEKGNSGKGTAFQIAANSGGLSVDNVAYTMNIVKTNLTNGQEIKEAKITMSVPESWVGANGGKDAIKIIRIAEDGKKEVLGTTYVGTTDGIMTFEGYSPNGLSMFGLVSTTEQPASPAPLNRGGSLAPSAGGQSDIGIDGAENLKAGDTATLYFDETGIYEMDLCAKEDIPEVFITVEAGITPEGAISPEGDLFEYIAAFLYDTEAESVSKYTVRFAVPTDWVNGRLSSPDLLSLYWYDEDKDEWTKLSTVFDSEKDGVCYYYADTASIGYLAIAAVPDLDQVKSPSLKSEAVGQTTLATAEKSTASVTTAATPKATPLFGDITIFVVFGLLCVIAIVNRRCRKTNKK